MAKKEYIFIIAPRRNNHVQRVSKDSWLSNKQHYQSDGYRLATEEEVRGSWDIEDPDIEGRIERAKTKDDLVALAQEVLGAPEKDLRKRNMKQLRQDIRMAAAEKPPEGEADSDEEE